MVTPSAEETRVKLLAEICFKEDRKFALVQRVGVQSLINTVESVLGPYEPDEKRNVKWCGSLNLLLRFYGPWALRFDLLEVSPGP